MIKQKFKFGDRVRHTKQGMSVGTVISTLYDGSIPVGYTVDFDKEGREKVYGDVLEPFNKFSDGVDIEERYAESVKDEVLDEEVPKELHPAVEKFKKLLDDTMVNHPPHYTAGKVECIDALEAATTGLQGIEAVCTANAIKYLWRQKHKNGIQDLKKAIFYIERLIQHYEQQEQSNG